MHVFISWSGDRSRRIGEVLRRWLPGVLQAVRPYFSPDDVAKGARWSNEIARELDASRIGLLILTRENLEAPWLMFEAGARAKNLDRSKVCPLLFGLEPADIAGPLVQFQASRFDVDEMRRVVQMINAELGDTALPDDVLENVFTMWWPRLEAEIAAELGREVEARGRARPEREMLEEILVLTRSSSRNAPATAGHQQFLLEDVRNLARSLSARYAEIMRLAAETPVSQELMILLNTLDHPITYLSRRTGGRVPRTPVAEPLSGPSSDASGSVSDSTT